MENKAQRTQNFHVPERCTLCPRILVNFLYKGSRNLKMGKRLLRNSVAADKNIHILLSRRSCFYNSLYPWVRTICPRSLDSI